MSQVLAFFPYCVAAWIFFIGLYGIVTSRHLVHTVLCVGVMQSSTYVLLLSIGFRYGGTAPIFRGIMSSTPAVDPIVQAVVLTDVVVETTVVALLLAIAVQIRDTSGELDPQKIAEVSG